MTPAGGTVGGGAAGLEQGLGASVQSDRGIVRGQVRRKRQQAESVQCPILCREYPDRNHLIERERKEVLRSETSRS